MALPQIPPQVLAALASRGGPGGPTPPIGAPNLGPDMMGGSPPMGAPPGAPGGGMPDAGMLGGAGPGMMPGMPADPSTPDGAAQLMQPLIMAQQAKLEGVKAEMAHSAAQALAQSMQNMDNPLANGAGSLPGIPPAPGDDAGPPAGAGPGGPPNF
jgi:hypothetical protein